MMEEYVYASPEKWNHSEARVAWVHAWVSTISLLNTLVGASGEGATPAIVIYPSIATTNFWNVFLICD